METHTVPETNPNELARANNGWASFTAFTKYGIISVIVILVLMAIFLL